MTDHNPDRYSSFGRITFIRQEHIAKDRTGSLPRAITERKVCSELSPRLPRMGAILQPPIRPEIRRIVPSQLLSAVQCADRNHEVFPLLDDDAVNGAAVLGDYQSREWYHIIARRLVTIEA